MTRAMPLYEVIVVGLGAVGSAATWHLARLGTKVLGIDRYEPPHEPRANIILRYAPVLNWTLLSFFAVDGVAKPLK